MSKLEVRLSRPEEYPTEADLIVAVDDGVVQGAVMRVDVAWGWR